MKLTKTLLKIAAPVIALVFSLTSNGWAQSTYRTANTATASGNANSAQVSDISNNGETVNRSLQDVTPIIFPMIGVAETAAAPVLQTDGSYNITYTINVQNYGGIELNNIQVLNDLLATYGAPMAFTKTSITVSGLNAATLVANPNYNGNADKNLLTALSSNLSIGGSGTITLVINVKPNGQYGTFNNTAVATALTNNATPVAVSDASTNNTSPTQGDNTGIPVNFTSPTPVTINAADLQVTNTVSNPNPNVNTNVTFTVKVKNLGTGDAAAVVLTDLLPAGYTFVSNTTSVGTYDPATGLWNLPGILTADTEQTLTITATVLPNKTGSQYTTTASTNLAGDPVAANNAASAAVTPAQVLNLGITNDDGQTTYTPGKANTYTIVVSNNGASDAFGATVANPLPAGATGSWTAVYTGGATGAASGNGAINELVNIPVNGRVTYTYTITLPSATTGNFVNTATVTPATGSTDADPADNTSSDTDTPNIQADLSITNSDGKTTYTPGTTNTYTFVVSNGGPSDVGGAVVTNTLPAGITGSWTAAFTGGATGTASGTGSINQTVNVPAGATITYTFVVTISSGTAGNFVNTANVAAPAGVTDPTPANNTATDTDTPGSAADLKILKTVSNAAASINTPVTFTLAVSNSGPSPATNVTVTDLLPNGYTFVNATPSAGNYNQATGVWAVGNLANGGNATLSMVATVNATGNYTNTATVTATEADPDASNNISQVTVGAKATPVANDDAASTNASTPVNINILGNDVKGDANLAPGSVTVVQQPAHGTVTINPTTGVATYTPNTGYFGTDNFTYTIKDQNGAVSNTANVTITIPKSPVAANDNATTTVNTPITIAILANDTRGDADLDPASIVITQQPAHGTLTIDPSTGSVVYKPAANYSGADVFTYTVKDKNGVVSNVATVNVTIPQAPVANNDSATTNVNTPVTIDVLANDTKTGADFDPATITIIQQPAHGTLIIDQVTGKVVYVPATTYAGPDVFTYTVKDKNRATTNVATVNINIVDTAKIGLAKAAVATTKAVNGSYDITYVLTVGNYGNTDLSSISIKDDLSQTFRGEQIVFKSIHTLGKLTVNPNYNGNSNIELLQTGNVLFRNQVEQIELTVNVTVLTGGTTYLNRATAIGVSTTGLTTIDQSTDGLKPDATTANDVSPATPTPVTLNRPNEFIPQGFSPNGDGVHDTFVIENASGRRVNLEFYNRWGNLVYRDTDYKNDWGGKCNQGIHIGEDLPEGTYYYIVRFDDKDRYVGFITLNR